MLECGRISGVPTLLATRDLYAFDTAFKYRNWCKGPTHPFNVCPVRCVSPSITSNTFTVLSDEHVARRFP